MRNLDFTFNQNKLDDEQYGSLLWNMCY